MQDETNGGDEVSPAVRIVEEVARATGVAAVELPPLYDVIDPDALEALVANSTGPVEVAFAYEGHEVTVRGDGRVRVE